MAHTIDGLQLEVAFPVREDGVEARVVYLPLSREGDGVRVLRDYEGQVDLAPREMDLLLQRKIVRLRDALEAALPQPPEVELGGVKRQGRARVLWFDVRWEPYGPLVQVDFRPSDLGRDRQTLRWMPDELSEATARLIENLRPTFEQAAWNEVHRRITGEVPLATSKRKVLISYRAGREKFAEAIAHRLGREGFLPWLDKWEVLAGDSLPREIGEGFRDVYGVVIVLTADYPGGKWAREELETAITKRVQESIRIVPVKYEPCDVPELLRPLRYVDCTDHSDDGFERQFKEIIDALNEIELNPYR